MRREFNRTVRKKSFWMVTFLLPAFMILVGVVSSFAASESEKKLEQLAKDVDRVLIVDQSKVVEEDSLSPPFESFENLEEGIDLVATKEADALFYYSDELLKEGRVDIYLQSENVITDNRFNDLAQRLLEKNLLQDMDEDKRTLLQQNYSFNLYPYEDGEPIAYEPEKLLIPIAAVLIFFVMVSFGVNAMLMSVAEEKENRMIETILSIVPQQALIGGKLLGLLGVVFAQVFLLFTMVVIIVYFFPFDLPGGFRLESVRATPDQLLWVGTYLLLGYVFLASVMVGAGAVMPTYKEASSLSAVFVIASVFPIYFSSLIVTDPSGFLATLLSYTPFTNSIILIFRSSLGEISLTEQIGALVVMLIYLFIGFQISYRLFALGALEVNNKVGVKRLKKAFFNS